MPELYQLPLGFNIKDLEFLPHLSHRSSGFSFTVKPYCCKDEASEARVRHRQTYATPENESEQDQLRPLPCLLVTPWVDSSFVLEWVTGPSSPKVMQASPLPHFHSCRSPGPQRQPWVEAA